jgi:CRISPR system Cascade subunit CasD
MEYLVFRLYGPLVSWGDIAVGGERRSATHPGRSAILGLIGAALGIERNDVEQQKELAENYGIAVKLVAPGGILKDYHTAQVPKAERKRIHHTRKSELSVPAGRLNTVLSSREYRTDALAIVAVWIKAESPGYTAVEIAGAFRKPAFHLYLGRKSCPLAIPVEAQVLNRGSLREALDDAVFSPLVCNGHSPERDARRERDAFANEGIWYFWEEHPNPGLRQAQRTERYDQPLNREHWHFLPRQEYMAYETSERRRK